MSIASLDMLALVTEVTSVSRAGSETTTMFYGLHFVEPGIMIRPGRSFLVHNLPTGENKYEIIKKLIDRLKDVSQVKFVWYSKLALGNEESSGETLFVVLHVPGMGPRSLAQDVSEYLSNIHDFGNSLSGELYEHEHEPVLLEKMKALIHGYYFHVSLFGDEFVLTVGSVAVESLYQEFRWVLGVNIYLDPRPPRRTKMSGGQKEFTIWLHPSSNNWDPILHGDWTRPEAEAVKSVFKMITSTIRDNLFKEGYRVGINFILSDPRFENMFNPRGPSPNEFYSSTASDTDESEGQDRDRNSGDQGPSGSGNQPRASSKSGEHSTYLSKSSERDQDDSRSREQNQPPEEQYQDDIRSWGQALMSSESRQYQDGSRIRELDRCPRWNSRDRSRSRDWGQPPRQSLKPYRSHSRSTERRRDHSRSGSRRGGRRYEDRHRHHIRGGNPEQIRYHSEVRGWYQDYTSSKEWYRSGNRIEECDRSLNTGARQHQKSNKGKELFPNLTANDRPRANSGNKEQSQSRDLEYQGNNSSRNKVENQSRGRGVRGRRQCRWPDLVTRKMRSQSHSKLGQNQY